MYYKKDYTFVLSRKGVLEEVIVLYVTYSGFIQPTYICCAYVHVYEKFFHYILYDLVFPQQGMITNNFIDTAWKFFHYMWYGCLNEWANQGVRF